MKKFLKRIILPASLLIIAIATISALSFANSQETQAASGANFNPGRIIDDSIFYNSNATDADQIQSFLNSKVPNCDTNGTGRATEWGRGDLTRAQYAASRGWNAPPYTCLKDYRQNTPQMEAASGLCSAISAGINRSSSQIINDISKACGINPQVLVVLLDKEQSLVTDIWPLQRQYRNATGFACPDTAPCDPAYEGFFYQVYYAARQFKVYKMYPNNYNYLAGRTNRIYWNPDTARCGSSQIYIENQATAALYIYTPYRPNQAALNNLYGSGDDCSSYGNRNFWRLFTDWFGSTLGNTIKPELVNRYNELGGADGVLGPITDDGYCNGDRTVCWQSFRNGSLIYNSSTGTWESKGGIRERWGQLGYQSSVLGYPSGPETAIGSTGVYQQFQNGRIFWREGTGAWSVRGAIGDTFNTLSGTAGILGYPIWQEIALSNGSVYQQFQNGRLYWKEGLGTWVVRGAIGNNYTEMNGSEGALGSPTAQETSSVNSGVYQQFENGRIYWKETTGAYSVHGGVAERYNLVSSNAGILGYPTGKETILSTGGVYQQFENGRIYWKGGTNGWVVRGAIGDRFFSTNSDKGYLGYPIAQEVVTSGGVSQQYQKGIIYWKDGLGAWSVHGGIAERYNSMGAASGSLGFPKSAETATGNSEVYQEFQNGRIYWSPSRGSWVTT